MFRIPLLLPRDHTKPGCTTGKTTKEAATGKTDDLIENLLNLPSTREKESKKVGEEILDLLSKPTAKERSLVEKFKSQGGASVSYSFI